MEARTVITHALTTQGTGVSLAKITDGDPTPLAAVESVPAFDALPRAVWRGLINNSPNALAITFRAMERRGTPWLRLAGGNALQESSWAEVDAFHRDGFMVDYRVRPSR